jgi:hypothetical protein
VRVSDGEGREEVEGKSRLNERDGEIECERFLRITVFSWRISTIFHPFPGSKDLNLFGFFILCCVLNRESN